MGLFTHFLFSTYRHSSDLAEENYPVKDFPCVCQDACEISAGEEVEDVSLHRSKNFDRLIEIRTEDGNKIPFFAIA